MIRFSRQLCSVPVLEDNRIIDVFRGVSCGICRVAVAGDNLAVPSGKDVGVGAVLLPDGCFRNSHPITVMVRFSRELRSVPVLEDNRIIDIFCGVGCSIGRICNTVCNRIIPTAERIASVNIAFFCRSLRSRHFISVMVRFPRKLCSVPILEDNRVIDEIFRVGRGIGRVAVAGDNLAVPSGKGVGVGAVLLPDRHLRSSHFISVMIRFSRQLCSVPVLEDNRIIDVFRGVSCDIGCVRNAICNRIIPTAERIASVNIAFFCRSFRSSHLVSVVIHIGLQKRSVLIQKADPIFQPNRIVDEVE